MFSLFGMTKQAWEVAEKFSKLTTVSDFLDKNFGSGAIQEHDPGLLKDLDKALPRITQAIENKERIMVFGDFDADGITATVILVDTLRRLGAKVSYRIPERAVDSHGLKTHLLDEIITTGSSLLITVDCGINDGAVVSQAGLDIIITDHHQVDPDKFPTTAVAVLNPHQSDCSYPAKNLSGAGVAFKLVQALARHYFPHPDPLPVGEGAIFCKKYLDILAIGMIADCMHLTGEVRHLVKKGLIQMRETEWAGLERLLMALKVSPESINEDTVGFYLGPVINAASRLGDVNQAVQLFLSAQDPEDRVNYLLMLNEQRREWSKRSTLEAQSQISPDQKYQIISTETWPVGVLGLVGGQICESLNQPVIVIRTEGNVLKASCRAPKWANIEKALQAKSELFDYVGGHPAAAGFSMPKNNLQLLRDHLTNYYDQIETPAPKPHLVYALSPEVINLELVNLIESHSPYGMGAPAPVWLLEDAEIVATKWLGADQAHARLDLKAGDKMFTAMMFRATDHKEALQPGKVLDVYFTLRRQIWRGEERLQLMITDLGACRLDAS